MPSCLSNSQCQGKLKEKMSNVKFFSLLLDNSTDCSNVEELFLALFFDPYSSAEEGTVHVRDNFIAVCHLAHGTGEGLYGCVKKSLMYMGVEWRSKMVGLGCDGTNANIGSDSGLKELPPERHPMVSCFLVLCPQAGIVH